MLISLQSYGATKTD